MSREISIQQASKTFRQVFNKVKSTKKSVIVKAEDGSGVRIIPVPKPIKMWKGRPVYNVEDIQFVGAPWFFD